VFYKDSFILPYLRPDCKAAQGKNVFSFFRLRRENEYGTID